MNRPPSYTAQSRSPPLFHLQTHDHLKDHLFELRAHFHLFSHVVAHHHALEPIHTTIDHLPLVIITYISRSTDGVREHHPRDITVLAGVIVITAPPQGPENAAGYDALIGTVIVPEILAANNRSSPHSLQA